MRISDLVCLQPKAKYTLVVLYYMFMHVRRGKKRPIGTEDGV
jgi:hypothetical protein